MQHSYIKEVYNAFKPKDIFIKLLFSNSYLFLIFLLFACAKSDSVDPNPKDSYRYFPIEEGDFKIFQKIIYSYAVGQKERIDSILVKETVTSKSVDNGDTYYIIERQTKGKNDLFYKSESVYKIITNPKQVVKGERNIYTLLLHYPVYVGAVWNINEINGQDEKEAEIVEYEKLPPKLITDKNLIKVESDSTKNFVDLKVNYNLFAKDIGLIYTENSYIDYCQDDDPNPVTSCTTKYIIESGKREFITLIEYGKNK